MSTKQTLIDRSLDALRRRRRRKRSGAHTGILCEYCREETDFWIARNFHPDEEWQDYCATCGDELDPRFLHSGAYKRVHMREAR
jgi:hypothetical protein